jgi:hypothetical protein
MIVVRCSHDMRILMRHMVRGRCSVMRVTIMVMMHGLDVGFFRLTRRNVAAVPSRLLALVPTGRT